MADKWYILIDDKKRGPATLDQLKQMIAVGKLKATDWIQEDGTGGWGVASAVNGLFPPDGSPPMTPCAAGTAGQAATAGESQPLPDVPASQPRRNNSGLAQPTQPPFSTRYREKVAAVGALFRANPLLLFLAGGGMAFLVSVCICGAFLSSVGLDPGKSDRPDEQIFATAEKKEAAEQQQAVQKQAEESGKEEGTKSTKEPAKNPAKEPAVKQAPAQEQKTAETARKKLVGKWIPGGGPTMSFFAEEFTADGKYIITGRAKDSKHSWVFTYKWLDDETIEVQFAGLASPPVPPAKKRVSIKGDELTITDGTGKFGTYWRVIGPDQPEPFGVNLTSPIPAAKFSRSTATKAQLKQAIVDGNKGGFVAPGLDTFQPIWNYEKYMEIIGAPDNDSAVGSDRLWRYKCSDGAIFFRVFRVNDLILFRSIESQ